VTRKERCAPDAGIRTIRRWVLPMLLCVAPQAGRAAADDIARRSVVDEQLSPWASGCTPGCAVGVSVDGRVVEERAAGLADLANNVPITPRTVFHAASISKQFTAFAIGLLEQRGRLSYADPVRKFVPELPKVMDGITIDQLIHHTDGLREQGQLLYFAGWRSDDVLTEDDILWALTRQRALNFAPGTEVVYGNAAYNLLAVVVRRVTGTALRDFAAAEIFAPLGMSLTRFGDGYSEVVGNRASSYVRGQGGAWRYAPLNIVTTAPPDCSRRWATFSNGNRICSTDASADRVLFERCAPLVRSATGRRSPTVTDCVCAITAACRWPVTTGSMPGSGRKRCCFRTSGWQSWRSAMPRPPTQDGSRAG
jgi:CubicO group peptidase (beta-lactamase class C family)